MDDEIDLKVRIDDVLNDRGSWLAPRLMWCWDDFESEQRRLLAARLECAVSLLLRCRQRIPEEAPIRAEVDDALDAEEEWMTQHHVNAWLADD